MNTLLYAVGSCGVLWVLVVGVLTASAAVLAGGRTLRLGLVTAIRSRVFPSVVFLVAGLSVLTSSGNKGSGFLAPLVPAAAAVAAWLVGRVGPASRRFIWGLLAVVVVVTTVGTAGPGMPFSQPLAIDVAGRTVTLSDNRGLTSASFADGGGSGVSGHGPTTQELRAWDAAVGDTLERLIRVGGLEQQTAWGFRHMMVNFYAIDARGMLTLGRGLPSVMIEARDNGDRAALTAWLTTGVARRSCSLLLSPGDSHEFRPVGDAASLEAAARDAGFTPTGSSWTIPDGRSIVLRQRASTCG